MTGITFIYRHIHTRYAVASNIQDLSLAAVGWYGIQACMVPRLKAPSGP